MAHLFKDVETFQKVMNMLTITTLPRCALNVIIRVLLAIRIIANQVIVLFSRCSWCLQKCFTCIIIAKTWGDTCMFQKKTQTKILHSLHLELWKKTFILFEDEFDVQSKMQFPTIWFLILRYSHFLNELFHFELMKIFLKSMYLITSIIIKNIDDNYFYFYRRYKWQSASKRPNAK